MFILKKWSIIWPVFTPTYKIINHEIEYSNSYEILKNRFKKNKKSSISATLNYLPFNILPSKNIKENTRATIKLQNGLEVGCFSRMLNGRCQSCL